LFGVNPTPLLHRGNDAIDPERTFGLPLDLICRALQDYGYPPTVQTGSIIFGFVWLKMVLPYLVL
jgi:hypothetical protein